MKDQMSDPGKVSSSKKSQHKFDYDFVGKAKYFATLSFVLIFASLVLIAVKGLDYGIDFAGGIEVQVKFNEAVKPSLVRQFTDTLGLKGVSVQSFGDESEYLIRMEGSESKSDQDSNEKLIESITQGLSQTFAAQGATILRVDSVGPQVGSDLKRDGFLAGFYCMLLILIYIGLRFDYKYAPSAIICLFHDVILTLGVFSLINHEVSVQTLAAILTIIGYSINDTIINFDRIRENEPLHRDKSMAWIVNRSINDMLSRTILTSGTTLMAVGALYLIADGVIKDLALTLGLGMVFGVYSSVYVAAPLVMLTERLQRKA